MRKLDWISRTNNQFKLCKLRWIYIYKRAVSVSLSRLPLLRNIFLVHQSRINRDGALPRIPAIRDGIRGYSGSSVFDIRRHSWWIDVHFEHATARAGKTYCPCFQIFAWLKQAVRVSDRGFNHQDRWRNNLNCMWQMKLNLALCTLCTNIYEKQRDIRYNLIK